MQGKKRISEWNNYLQSLLIRDLQIDNAVYILDIIDPKNIDAQKAHFNRWIQVRKEEEDKSNLTKLNLKKGNISDNKTP